MAFQDLNTFLEALLALKVSTDKSAGIMIDFPLYVTCVFSLAAFKILLCSIYQCFNYDNAVQGFFSGLVYLVVCVCFVSVYFFLSLVWGMFFFSLLYVIPLIFAYRQKVGAFHDVPHLLYVPFKCFKTSLHVLRLFCQIICFIFQSQYSVFCLIHSKDMQDLAEQGGWRHQQVWAGRDDPGRSLEFGGDAGRGGQIGHWFGTWARSGRIVTSAQKGGSGRLTSWNMVKESRESRQAEGSSCMSFKSRFQGNSFYFF